MKVYERIIAQSIPPTNGSVIWINTSQVPYTVNIFANGAWYCMGAMHDSELLQRILDIIGSPSSEEGTIAGDLQLVINTLSNLSKKVENDTRDAFSSYTMLQMLEEGIDIPNIIYSNNHGGCYIRTGRQRTVSGELQSEWVGVEGDDKHKVFVWGTPYEDPAVLFSENGQYYDSVDDSRAVILPTRDDINTIDGKVGTPSDGQPTTLFGAIEDSNERLQRLDTMLTRDNVATPEETIEYIHQILD